MNGIYLTQEGKQEIEAKIAELEDYTYATQDIHLEGSIQGHIYALKEILSLATILPVEESWESVSDYITSIEQSYYPNGVIIQPKQ
jgi:hypothetical protein